GEERQDAADPEERLARHGDLPRDQLAEVDHDLRELDDQPAGRGEQYLQQPGAEDDQQEVGVDAPLGLEEKRQELVEDAGDESAPDAEDPAEQRGRGEGEGVLRL